MACFVNRSVPGPHRPQASHNKSLNPKAYKATKPLSPKPETLEIETRNPKPWKPKPSPPARRATQPPAEAWRLCSLSLRFGSATPAKSCLLDRCRGVRQGNIGSIPVDVRWFFCTPVVASSIQLRNYILRGVRQPSNLQLSGL